MKPPLLLIAKARRLPSRRECVSRLVRNVRATINEHAHIFAAAPIVWYTTACLKKVWFLRDATDPPPVSQARALPLIVSKLTDNLISLFRRSFANDELRRQNVDMPRLWDGFRLYER